ncbi:MAG: hypothetical protein RMJ43_11830 [Chloroherpetonaceae bacterium]|nr:hypothetical protein [Chthonomonadaceae bacterium]MDW8208517.1 hypothetical protein [Chloroherpetonaceae bacterium]
MGTQSVSSRHPDRAVLGVAAGTLLAGAALAGWIWYQRPRTPGRAPGTASPHPVAPSVRAGVMSGMIPPSAGVLPASGTGVFPYLPPAEVWKHGLLPGRFSRMPQPIPRYFANLATQAGPYMVSIRQVILESRRRYDLYTNQPEGVVRPAGDPISLSLQVMCVTPEPLQNVADFAPRLVLVDDRGQRYVCDNAGQLQTFERGMARVVGSVRLSPDARYLKSVEGQILLKPDPAGKAGSQAHNVLTFRIQNVPLPVENHLFGVASAVFLPPEHARTFARIGSLVALAPQHTRRLSRLFPPYVPEPGPLRLPNRLLLQSDVMNTFLVPLPGGKPPLKCTLRPVLGTDGEIQAECTLAMIGSPGEPIRAALRLWDDEPQVLLCPERVLNPEARGTRQVALWLHLYTDRPAEWRPTTSPFPATGRERGGSLIGQVRVGQQPLCRGTARLEIAALDEASGTYQNATELEVMLDTEGRWCLANISPGTYRVRALRAVPYRSAVVRASDPDAYLRRRCGLKRPVILQADQAGLRVQGGGQVTVKPFILAEQNVSAGNQSTL